MVLSMPRAQAGLAVSQRMACSRVMLMPGVTAGVHRLGRLLVEPLNPLFAVGVDDRAGAGLLQQGSVLGNAVERLHLETPPVGPDRARYAVPGQQVGDLVCLYRMVEGADVKAEFPGEIQHLRHLVGPIAVVLDEGLAPEHVGQRLQLEIAVRRISLFLGQPCVPVAPIFLCLGEGGAIARHVAHPGGGTLLLVYSLGVLATGHLHAVGSAGIFHLLHRARRNQSENGRASADEIGRAGQRLNHGDASRHRQRDLWVLGPEGMLGPDLRRIGVGGLVAVILALGTGRGVDPQVAMGVDDPGRDVLAASVNYGRIPGRSYLGPNSGDFAILQHNRRVLELGTGCGEDGGVSDDDRGRRVPDVRGRILGAERAQRIADSGGARGCRGAGDEENQCRRDENCEAIVRPALETARTSRAGKLLHSGLDLPDFSRRPIR